MTRNRLRSLPMILVLVLIGWSSTSSAVRLSTDDTGQVLLFPLTTKALGLDTLLSVTNHDPRVSVIARLTLRAAEDGTVLAADNVYLARASWPM